MWLYKFLINVLEDKWCIGPGCTTCGSLEFRAKLISNLNCFKENIDPSQLLRNNQNSLIGPVYYKLSDDIKKYGRESFAREILSLHTTPGRVNYEETRQLFLHGVLTESLTDGTPAYYNSNILGRYYRKDYFDFGNHSGIDAC